MKNILIAGGTGLIGQALSSFFEQEGYSIAVLSRSKRDGYKYRVFQWSPLDGFVNEEAMEWADIVINLAGESIASGIWTAAKKQRIKASRIMSTRLIVRAISEADKKPHKLINASAIGYYGDGGDQILMEDSHPGAGFMSELCLAWEEAAKEVSNVQVDLGIVRIGLVLTKEGGFLGPLKKLTYLGFGGYFDGGDQYLPWIHIDDLVGVFKFVLDSEENKLIVNAVGPEPVKFKEMLMQLGIAMGKRPILIPTPSFLVKPFLGDMAEIFLNSARVQSDVLESSNFQYTFSELSAALKDLVEFS